MKATELMTSFAQAILAMNRAVEASDKDATAEAIASIIYLWNLQVGDDQAITVIVEHLSQALDDNDSEGKSE